MDDAIQYSAALSVKAEYIVSYDKHFDGLEIPRKTPEKLTKL
jgi:predicted nucleic acid-binding protein